MRFTVEFSFTEEQMKKMMSHFSFPRNTPQEKFYQFLTCGVNPLFKIENVISIHLLSPIECLIRETDKCP